MIRTQVQLTEEQARALKELAAQRGVSMSELVRQAVERILEEREETEKWRRALEIVGRYHSGHSDISVEHDKYLDEIYSYCVSFEMMRLLGLDTAFTFDAHFADQGFRCIP